MYIINEPIILNKLEKNAETELIEVTNQSLENGIRNAVISEEKAIIEYTNLMEQAENTEIKDILKDIANEEKVHVGELLKILNKLNKNELEKIEDGIDEDPNTEELKNKDEI